MTTKAARIRALYAEGKTCKEIAAIVGCLPAYARVYARQRQPGAGSHADRKWREGDHYKAYQREYWARRWREDAEFRQRITGNKRRRLERLRAEGASA